MAIIYSYPAIDEISTGDLILVSDSSKNNATKSASVDQLKAYTNTGQATITQVNDRVVTGASFNTSTGSLTLTRNSSAVASVTTNLDGRYALTTSVPTNNNQLTNGAGYTTNLGVVQTLTTTGTSGAATLANGTLNIPQYSGGGGVTSIIAGTGISVNQSTGDVTITNTGSVTGAYSSFTRTFTGNELVNAFNGNVSDSITLISVPSGKIGFVERAVFIIKGASTGTTNYNANGSLYVFPTGATTSSNQVNILSSALNAGSDYFFTSTNPGIGNSVAAVAPVGGDIVLGRPSGGSGVTISQGDRDVVLYVIYKILDF